MSRIGDFFAQHRWVILAGLAMGAAGSLLAFWGNPVNTGLCISCFLENAVGAVGLHANPRMNYMRPELLGFFLGSFVAAAGWREFRPRSGGIGFGGLGLGVLMIVGSAVFIGCPIKAVLRLAAGDLTALAGFSGLTGGVWLGLLLLRGPDMKLEGPIRPASTPVALGGVAGIALLAALVFVPGALRQSATGGGALHAPAALSLGAGLGLGVLCQRSRFCITGSLRDMLLTRNVWTGVGLPLALFAALGFNLVTGQFHPGYFDQPGSHLEWLWSFLGLALVGWAAVLAGGCPFRQIIKAGEGDFDAAIVCVGMLLGAALVQSWQLGGNAAGVPPQGKVVVLIGFAALACLGLVRKKGVA